MKKLIRKILIALLPFWILWVYTIAFPMCYVDKELPYYYWNKDFVQTAHEETYDVLFLGDSSSNAAFLPSVLGEHTASLSLGGITPIETYYILEEWLQTNAAPKTVYLMFMDYHMQYDNMFKERVVYSHRLSFSTVLEIYEEGKKTGDEGILGGVALEDIIATELRLPTSYMAALKASLTENRREINETAYQTIDENQGFYIGLTDTIYQDDTSSTYSEYHVNSLFDNYYQKILALCEQHQIKVHIISAPKPDNSILEDTYKSQRDSYYEALTQKYSNVTYYAQLDIMPMEYYQDWQHFNYNGAVAFSNIIKETYPEDFS